MEVSGKIKFIGTTTKVSASFNKRELVITTDEQYPQHILIQFVQDKCDMLDKFKVGDSVEVGVNLRGREWVNAKQETVYFNTIQGWKISNVRESAKDKPAFEPAGDIQEVEDDGLPF